MTDIFSQQGINFQSSSMASTSPSANPQPIEAPKVDMENAPANATPAVPAQAAPAQNSGNASQDDRDYLTQLTDPQQAPQSLAGAGSEGSAGAEVAPPQPQAHKPDIFDKMGIAAPSLTEIAENPFQGVPIPPPAAQDDSPKPIAEIGGYDKDGKPVTDPVAYAQNMQGQDQKLGRMLFSQQELDGFKNNTVGFFEAFEKQNRYGYLAGDPNAAAISLAPIALKVANKEQLTPEDQEKELEAFTKVFMRKFSDDNLMAEELEGIKEFNSPKPKSKAKKTENPIKGKSSSAAKPKKTITKGKASSPTKPKWFHRVK